VYDSTLGLSVTNKKKKRTPGAADAEPPGGNGGVRGGGIHGTKHHYSAQQELQFPTLMACFPRKNQLVDGESSEMASYDLAFPRSARV